MTCQANKRLVLNAARVEQAFADKRVVLLRADWTQRDDAITHELARFQRNGVPVYVLYDRARRARASCRSCSPSGRCSMRCAAID